MRNFLKLTASIALGLTAAAGITLTGINAHSATQESVSRSVSVSEDSPAFDCLTDGNRVCGAVMMDETRKTAAWEAWDAQQGWTQVRVDPTREFRIDLGNYSTEPLHQGIGTVVLASPDGFYYTYTVTYL